MRGRKSIEQWVSHTEHIMIRHLREKSVVVKPEKHPTYQTSDL